MQSRAVYFGRFCFHLTRRKRAWEIPTMWPSNQQSGWADILAHGRGKHTRTPHTHTQTHWLRVRGRAHDKQVLPRMWTQWLTFIWQPENLVQNMKKVLTSLLFFRGDRSDSVSFIMTWMCRNHTGADRKSHRNNFSMGYNGGKKVKL